MNSGIYWGFFGCLSAITVGLVAGFTSTPTQSGVQPSTRVIATLSAEDLELGMIFHYQLMATSTGDGADVSYELLGTSSGSVESPMAVTVTYQCLEQVIPVDVSPTGENKFKISKGGSEITSVHAHSDASGMTVYDLSLNNRATSRVTASAIEWTMRGGTGPSLPTILAVLSASDSASAQVVPPPDPSTIGCDPSRKECVEDAKNVCGVGNVASVSYSYAPLTGAVSCSFTCHPPPKPINP